MTKQEMQAEIDRLREQNAKLTTALTFANSTIATLTAPRVEYGPAPRAGGEYFQSPFIYDVTALPLKV